MALWDRMTAEAVTHQAEAPDNASSMTLMQEIPKIHVSIIKTATIAMTRTIVLMLEGSQKSEAATTDTKPGTESITEILIDSDH